MTGFARLFQLLTFKARPLWLIRCKRGQGPNKASKGSITFPAASQVHMGILATLPACSGITPFLFLPPLPPKYPPPFLWQGRGGGGPRARGRGRARAPPARWHFLFLSLSLSLSSAHYPQRQQCPPPFHAS